MYTAPGRVLKKAAAKLHAVIIKGPVHQHKRQIPFSKASMRFCLAFRAVCTVNKKIRAVLALEIRESAFGYSCSHAAADY